MKIVVSADWHIDANRRWDDTKNTLKRLVDETIKQKPDYFVFVGDGFKSWHPIPLEMELFRQTIFAIANAKIGVFIVVGNHDTPESGQYEGSHCFIEFEDWVEQMNLKNIKVIDGPHIQEFGEFVGYFVPHIPKAAVEKSSFADVYAKILTDFREHKGNKKGIVFSHVYIAEAKLGAGDMVICGGSRQVPAQWFKEFNLVFCGDVHKAQKIEPNIYYPGSTERIDFGEAGDIKGMIAYDSKDDGVDFINLNTRNMEEIVMDLVNPGFVKSTTRGDTRTTERTEVEIDNCLMYIAKALEAKREQLRDAIVKVRVICTKEQKAQIGDCDEKLNDLLLNELKVHSVKSISYEITDKVSVRNSEINESLGPVAALNKFLGMQEYKPDTAQQIRIAGEKIIKG